MYIEFTSNQTGEIRKMAKIIYELPQEKEKVAEVIACIPSNWKWVDGYLSAPRDGSCQISENTQLLISRFYLSTPTIVGRRSPSYKDWPLYRDWERESKLGLIPKLGEIFIEKKLFSSIRFDEAAFEAPPFEEKQITMDDIRSLAQYFIKEGYMGWINAYSGHKNNYKYNNPERFALSHSDWLIKLEYCERYSGSKKNLEGIMENFSKLGIDKIGED
jgi:hypothetical protein